MLFETRSKEIQKCESAAVVFCASYFAVIIIAYFLLQSEFDERYWFCSPFPSVFFYFLLSLFAFFPITP